MTYIKIIIALMLFCPLYALAQESVASKQSADKELLFYKAIYKAGDSLHAIKDPKLLDTEAFGLANSLDKTNPVSYYMKAGQLLSQHKFNDASFIFYLGKLRFRYYNSADPDYQVSSGGALMASLDYEVGEPIDMYLHINIDCYISILKACSAWVSNHDYQYFSKTKAPEKYTDQIKGINSLISELENNREKYIKQWTDDRATMEKSIDDAIKQVGQK